MVNQKTPYSPDATYLRKIRKPMVEKRRRDRMNNSLALLKSLLAVNVKQSSTTSLARLDKADILELTVSHLTNLQHQHRSASLATTVESYKKGFKDCARETFNYLSSNQALDADSLQQINSHLQTCYRQKIHYRTTPGSKMTHRAGVTSEHAHLRKEVLATDDYSYPSFCVSDSHRQERASYNSYIYGQYEVSQALTGHEHSKLNDSVDTSLNSSCNMSLDTSSIATPEKIVPDQSSGSDVWRPW